MQTGETQACAWMLRESDITRLWNGVSSMTKRRTWICVSKEKNPVDVTFPVNLRLELVNKSSNDIVEYFVSSSSLPREMLRPPVTLKPNRPSLEECVTRAC